MTDSTMIQWKLSFAAGYLVPPSLGMDPHEISTQLRGSTINITSLPDAFFCPLFEDAPAKAQNLVIFVSDTGKQSNPVREIVRTLAFQSSGSRPAAARELAVRLASVTSRRSPHGLFLVLVGAKGSSSRVVLWKFPADESIQARLVDSRLLISIVDDAFSRRSTYFKAAVFEDIQTNTCFWEGRVEDRQAGGRVREVADFWVYDFLQCRPALTSVHGTRLLANALRETIRRAEDETIRDALISLIPVLKAQAGLQLTLQGFAEQFVPPPSRQDFLSLAGGEDVWNTPFQLDTETLADQIRVRSLTVNDQFTLRCPIDTFDDVVSIEPTPTKDIVRVSLRGRVTSQALLKR